MTVNIENKLEITFGQFWDFGIILVRYKDAREVLIAVIFIILNSE